MSEAEDNAGSPSPPDAMDVSVREPWSSVWAAQAASEAQTVAVLSASLAEATRYIETLQAERQVIRERTQGRPSQDDETRIEEWTARIAREVAFKAVRETLLRTSRQFRDGISGLASRAKEHEAGVTQRGATPASRVELHRLYVDLARLQLERSRGRLAGLAADLEIIRDFAATAPFESDGRQTRSLTELIEADTMLVSRNEIALMQHQQWLCEEEQRASGGTGREGIKL